MSDEKKSTDACPQGHKLTKFKAMSNRYTCDKCKERQPLRASLYGCRACDWDVCPACAGKDEDKLAIDVLLEHPAGIGDGIKPKKFDSLTGHPAAIRKVRKSWVPLESDPGLLNRYLKKMGASGAEFTEIWGFDDDMLSFVPQPVRAVFLCFPITENSENFRAEEEKKLAANGQEVSPNVYHIKQIIGNACGTIGLLHTVMNNLNTFTLEEGKFWSNFYNETKSMTNLERAQALEDNEDIEEEHQSVAAQGGSSASHATNDNLHYIVFGEVDGHLYEFDGRKERAINHGPVTDVLRDSIRVVRKFMAFAPGDMRLSALALTVPQ